MKFRHLIMIVLFSSVLAVTSQEISYAFFASNAGNMGNSFTTSSSFPTSPLPPSPAGPQAGDVVINEINWGGSHLSGADEWVELRNTTGSAVNLTNWVVHNLGSSGSPDITITSGTIPANGFFLIANAAKTESEMNVDPDFITTSISLVDAGEELVLKDSNGTSIDTANQTGAWFFGSNTNPRKSMERKTTLNDGALAESWQMATTHNGMDGNTPTDEFGTPKNVNGL